MKLNLTNVKRTTKKTNTNRIPNSATSNKLSTNRSKKMQSNETINQTTKIDDNFLNKKVKEMMWPWVKTPFNLNQFDNRFKAQEKLLHEQQKMMKGMNI